MDETTDRKKKWWEISILVPLPEHMIDTLAVVALQSSSAINAKINSHMGDRYHQKYNVRATSENCHFEISVEENAIDTKKRQASKI